MKENATIPEKLRRFYIVPLDKPGRDPKECKNERPIALLSPKIKLLELVMVRRQHPLAQARLPTDQYAYQRASSTEILLSDLNRFVEENRNKGRVIYMMGLDAAGAFHSASRQRIIDALICNKIPTPVSRLKGIWLTHGVSRVRLNTPLGTVYSKNTDPARVVPQGGALSPLLWLLHVHSITKAKKTRLRELVPNPAETWDLILQIFADDASGAVARKNRECTAHIGWLLKGVLVGKLTCRELAVEKQKSRNFLIEMTKQGKPSDRTKTNKPKPQSKRKRQTSKRTRRDQVKLITENQAETEKKNYHSPHVIVSDSWESSLTANRYLKSTQKNTRKKQNEFWAYSGK